MSDDSKVCPKCNTDISIETGECSCCSQKSKDFKTENQIDQSEIIEQENTDQTLFLIFILLVNIPISIFFANWLSDIFPSTGGFFSKIGMLVWLFTFIPTGISFLIFFKIVTEPKNSIFVFKRILFKGVPFIFEQAHLLIVFLLIKLAKLAVSIFFILLGLSLIVFAFKFIKSQLFG
jgi:hypothetical protein